MPSNIKVTDDLTGEDNTVGRFNVVDHLFFELVGNVPLTDAGNMPCMKCEQHWMNNDVMAEACVLLVISHTCM